MKNPTDDRVFQFVNCIIQTMANKDIIFKGIFQEQKYESLYKTIFPTGFIVLIFPFQYGIKKEKSTNKKIDGVGPIDPRPSTNKRHHSVHIL